LPFVGNHYLCIPLFLGKLAIASPVMAIFHWFAANRSVDFFTELPDIQVKTG
jgi:hypothetical protein